MPLTLEQSAHAVGISVPASFLGVGGTPPYSYAVVPGGAGGSVNPTTGAYIAPPSVPTTPATQADTVRVTDSLSATADATVLVGDALLLFCDVVQRGMGLTPDRVWIWDQKIFQPTDQGLFVTVAEMEPRVIANNNSSPMSGDVQRQYVTYASRLEVNLISRDVSARLRRTDFLCAIRSAYAERQQKLNGFYIGPTPRSFTNMSVQDGAAIPYRYVAWVGIQYSEPATSAQDYFDTFENPPDVAVNQ